MKKKIFGCFLIMVFFVVPVHAFFFGVGSAGGAKEVIKKGQEEGKIPKTPDTGGETTIPPVQKGVEVVWQDIYNGGGGDVGYAITVDSSGNVYITGCTRWYPSDYLTIKYNSNGDIIWYKTHDEANYDRGCGIAVDSSKNVYIVGEPGGSWFNILKYNSNGDTVWQKTEYNDGYAITIDKSDNVYVVGADESSHYIKKYNPDGNMMWKKKTPGVSNIAVDLNNSIYLTGGSTIKCNSNGDTVWQKTYYGGNFKVGNDVTVDSSGNVYVVGYSYNGTDNDYLIIKYNSDGDVIWQKTYDGGKNDYGEGIVVDSSGNVYVTGWSYNTKTWKWNCFTIKYNSNGDIIWQERYDEGQSQSDGYDITIDSFGYIYVTGNIFNGSDENCLTIKYRQIKF